MLQVIKGVVLEKCVRIPEAKEIILGVLSEIEENKILDHYLLDTLERCCSRMVFKDEVIARLQ